MSATLNQYPAAHLLGFFNIDTGEFCGAGIFSERSPTVGTKYMPVILREGWGHNYEEGLASLRQHFAHDRTIQWVRRWLGERDTHLDLPPFEDPWKADPGDGICTATSSAGARCVRPAGHEGHKHWTAGERVLWVSK